MVRWLPNLLAFISTSTPLPCQQDFAKGETIHGICGMKREVICGCMAQVQTSDHRTSEKEKCYWRRLMLSYMCAHNRLSFLKHSSVVVTNVLDGRFPLSSILVLWGLTCLEVISLLATANYPHIGSISPTSASRFLLWFIWLNEPMINGRFFSYTSVPI